MSTSFEWALAKTLHHEGGFVDDPADPGGATYKGVSLRFLRGAGEDINGDGDVDIDDIRALQVDKTDEALHHIYKNHFWTPNKLNEIPSELLQCKIFDMCVNMGGRQAWRLVQRALIHSGQSLTIDGIVGPKTVASVAQLAGEDYVVLGMIRKEQARFYDKLIERRPGLAKFRLGWQRRAAQ